MGTCATTDASGHYSLTLPVGSGPLWVEATGGSYTDEVTPASTFGTGINDYGTALTNISRMVAAGMPA